MFPQMTAGVPEERKFRLYIETLAQLKDSANRFVRWTDFRLLRRMVRDMQFRNHNPRQTLVHWHYVRRYVATRSKSRRRELRRRFEALVDRVERLQRVCERLCEELSSSSDGAGRQLAEELGHYLPLVRRVCEVARRNMLQGEPVRVGEKIFSLFEEHTELICRGRGPQSVNFGHQVWLSQTRQKFITDFEVMNPRRADSEVLGEIIERHGEQFGSPPKALAADKGFHCCMEKRTAAHRSVETLAIPRYHPRWDEPAAAPIWQDFRAGIEGTISTLKRAFRLGTCMYRGFKSFQAAVGMAVFTHNLLVLSCRPSRC